MNGVSIIICCYNSEKLLPETLRHISLQKVKDTLKWEIIIVNNNSSDKTGEIAREEWNKYCHTANCSFQIVDEPNPGLSNARKKGLDNSIYDVIIYCDDDNWLYEDYVQTAYDSMLLNETTAVTGGCGYPVFENDYEPEWFHLYAKAYALGPQNPEVHKYVYGAGMVVRKKYLENLYNCGFTSLLTGRKGNSLTSGEDTELCCALILSGYNIEYDENLKFKHFITEKRLNYEYLKKMYAGFAQADVIINIYRDVNAKKNVNEIFYPVFKVFISIMRIVYHQIFPEFRQKRKILLIQDKRIFTEQIRHFFQYKLYIRKIKRLKTIVSR
jgi:glycosyltransferase involved in cell wall biosynthesis